MDSDIDPIALGVVVGHGEGATYGALIWAGGSNDRA